MRAFEPILLAAVTVLANTAPVCAQGLAPAGKIAPKPLYRDPPFDAPTDPVLCYNAEQRKWLMYYTARRAAAENAPGVTWIHGTNIGIAESSDGGASWTYRGTADIRYGKDEHPEDYTYWAPEVIWTNGVYHMFLSYVQWEPKGNAVTDRNGEGPKVFHWKSRYWFVADTWATGIRVWSSDDCLNWSPQEETLPGSHGDVVVSGGRAWWFYFGGTRTRGRRTAINVIELSVADGKLLAGDPDRPTYIDLKPEREAER
jgi:hypothetical protein